MAGTIVADTLTHSTAGSVTTNFVVNGSAKAWLQYNQTTPAVAGSFNVSSISDDSTGIFSPSLTSSLNSVSDCCVTAISNHDSGESEPKLIALRNDQGGSFTTSIQTLAVYNAGTATGLYDNKFNFGLIHGDLA